MERNVTPDDIERRVLAVLDGIGQRLGSAAASNITWTAELNNGLAPVAREMGIDHHARYCAGSHEWPYDVTWTLKDKCGRLSEAPLIVESEWSPYDADVLYDFRKLLLGRAGHRVLVFERPNKEVSEQLIGRMCNEIEAFRGSDTGDRYLFAVWEYEPKPRRFRHEVVIR